MSKNHKVSRNWPKNLLQWGSLAILVFFLSGLAGRIFSKAAEVDPEAYCPFGGIAALATYGTRGSLPCSMNSVQIMMGIVLIIGVILFSKLFCGFLCPIGTVQDLIFRLGKNLGIKGRGIRNGSAADKALRSVKYFLLFWIVYMTAVSSELFCKNLDPYYAIATGFKGEITLWMSVITISIVVIGAFFADRFWCRYVCPLGAASNTFKFWIRIAALFVVWIIVNKFVSVSWFVLLGLFCVIGYLLEIFSGKPKLQIFHVVKNDEFCNRCGLCSKSCPYGINVSEFDTKVDHVDCTLCGECVTACNRDALSIGVSRKSGNGCFRKILPAALTLLLLVLGFILGSSLELPTISEEWGEPVEVQTMEVQNLRSVKCYSSSMAFKAKLEKIEGTCGVKTFVGKHRVVISYDPTVTSEEKILEEIFVPSKFRVNSPDPASTGRVKVVTIRTEKMTDKMDLNYLGLRMRQSDKKIFGLESEYDCPLIVRIFLDPEENIDREWCKEIVERKSLEMPTAGGGVKETPTNYEFVRLEEGESFIPMPEYLERMFDSFSAEYKGKESGEGQPQFIYEIADKNYEKPIVKRALPYLSNHLSKQEGVLGTYLELNKDLVPSIRIRYAAPMTAERLWELITMDKWTITYSDDDVREEGARLSFKTPGVSFPAEELRP